MSSDSDAPLGDIRRKIQSSSNVPMSRPTKKVVISSSSSEDEVVEKVRKEAKKPFVKKTKGGENLPPSKCVSLKKQPLPKKMRMKESEEVKEEVMSNSTDDSEPRKRKIQKINNEEGNLDVCEKSKNIADSDNEEAKPDASMSSTTVLNSGVPADTETLDSDHKPVKIPDARTAETSATSINDSDQEEAIFEKNKSLSSSKLAVTVRDDGDTSDTSIIDSDEDGKTNSKQKAKTAFTKTSAKEAGDTSDTSIEDDTEAAAEKKLSEEKRRAKKKSKNLTKQRIEDGDASEKTANKKKEQGKSEAVHKSGDDMAKSEKKQSTGKTASEAAAFRLVRLKKMAHIAGLRFNYKKLFEDCSADKERVKLLESKLINNGLETPLTIESCKTFKLRREQEAELAELSKNTIIDIGAGEKTRVTRSRYSAVAPPTSSARRGRATLDTSDEEDDEEPDERPQTGKEMFSNLRGIISSGGESSD